MFLIPSISAGIAEIASSHGVIPVCAVYSSIPVTSMKFGVIISGIRSRIDLASHTTHEGFGLNFMTLSPTIVEQIFTYTKLCIVKTKWETIETDYNIVVNGSYKYIVNLFCFYHLLFFLETPSIPNVCLWVTIDPLVKNITLGESFTVECVVYSLSSLEGSTVELFHIDTMGNERFIPINSTEDDQNHDIYRYYATVNEASVKDFGEYTCRFRFDEYNLERNDSLRIYGYESKESIVTYYSLIDLLS